MKKAGIGIPRLKTTLMDRYDLGSTEVDSCGDYPVIYCKQFYFKVNGKWFPQDHIKIGKTNRAYLRARTYGQGGADVRTLWHIGTSDTKWLEEKIHKYLSPYKTTDREIYATECFNLDAKKAYKLLNEMADVLNLRNQSCVREIVEFDNNGISNSEELNFKNFKPRMFTPDKTVRNEFYNLFSEVA